MDNKKVYETPRLEMVGQFRQLTRHLWHGERRDGRRHHWRSVS
ncbi:hypothetical protein ACQPZF_14835 [Actinosynnema sp. CS-041913]